MDGDIRRCYQLTGALNVDGLARPEQDLRIIGNFNATVHHQWLSFNFQIYAVNRDGARGVGAMADRTLTVTIDEELAMQCNWPGNGGKMAVSTRRFVKAIIGKLIS